MAGLGARRSARSGACQRHGAEELENGATGLSLVFAGAVGDHGFGLLPARATLGRVLEGIDLATTAIELDVSPQAETAIDASPAKNLTLFRRAEDLRVGHDPLGAMALSGGAPRRWTDEAPHFARRLAALARNGAAQKLAAADGRIIHNAGGSEAQELAFVISAARCLSARAGSRGIAARTGARHDFFPPRCGCGSVPHHRQIPRFAKIMGAHRGGVPAFAHAGLRHRRDRVADDDAARSAREHVARNRRGVCRWPSAAPTPSACCRTPPRSAYPMSLRGGTRATRSLFCAKNRTSPASPTPAPVQARWKNLTDQLCNAAWSLLQEIETAAALCRTRRRDDPAAKSPRCAPSARPRLHPARMR